MIQGLGISFGVGLSQFNRLFRFKVCSMKFFVSAFPDEKILEWKQVIDESYVAVFTISNDTRSLTSMILAAYYIGLNEKVVLCIQDLPSNCVINNEMVSEFLAY